MIGAVAAMILAGSSAQDDEQAKRFAAIEALQKAGVTAASANLCPMVGYTMSDGSQADYIAREVEAAKGAGMYEEMGYSYATSGMTGQSTSDLNRMNRLTQLVEAGDPAGKAGVAVFIDELVDRCDLLASRSETRPFFSYVPLNAQVAKRIALKKMGLVK